MENVEPSTSRQRYPFFLKGSTMSSRVFASIEGNVEGGKSVCKLPEPTGNGRRDECCAPGLRLGGWNNETKRWNCGLEGEVARVRGTDLRQRIIRSVIACCSAKSAEEVVRHIRETVSGAGNGTAANWIAITAHKTPGFEHVHVAHDCSYTGSQCKCAFLNKYKRGNQAIRGETNFLPFIRKKAGADLRPIYGAQCKIATDNYIINLLQ